MPSTTAQLSLRKSKLAPYLYQDCEKNKSKQGAENFLVDLTYQHNKKNSVVKMKKNLLSAYQLIITRTLLFYAAYSSNSAKRKQAT